MTNRSSSKQHGLVGNVRPKSSQSKRKNKAKAKARKITAASEFQSFMKIGKQVAKVTKLKAEAPKVEAKKTVKTTAAKPKAAKTATKKKVMKKEE